MAYLIVYIFLSPFSETIEMNKRMLQQRLITTKEDAQKKYEKIKQLILKDARLNLPADI